MVAWSNSLAVGRRTWIVASESTTMGSIPLAPRRSHLFGTQVTPPFNDGAKKGPTRMRAAASYSGCSGAQMRRSGGQALKVTSAWKTPVSAIMPRPMRSSSIGLYAIHMPGSASSDPSNPASV